MSAKILHMPQQPDGYSMARYVLRNHPYHDLDAIDAAFEVLAYSQDPADKELCRIVADEMWQVPAARRDGNRDHDASRRRDVRRAGDVGGEVGAVKWQPIETAPMDGTDILIFQRIECSNGDVVLAYGVANWTGNYWDDRIDMPPYPRPTHWMPLPPPPETTK